jgi:hypothetical protein
MTERIEVAYSMREDAVRLRKMANGVEPRLAAELIRMALSLDKDAIELETWFRQQPPNPPNDKAVA